VRGPGGLDTAAIRRSWPDILGWIFRHKRTTWTLLSEHATVLDYDGSRVLLGISTVGIAHTFRAGPHAELVRQAMIDVLGVDARVEGVPTAEAEAPATASPDAARRPPGHTTAMTSPTAPDPSSEDPTTSDGAWANVPDTEGWASAPSAPDSGPSWSHAPGPTGGVVSTAYPDPEAALAPDRATGDRREGPGADFARSPLKRAMAVVEAEGPGDQSALRVADDGAASDDDEDIDAPGEVGRPVVERLLGGQVIHDGPEPG
jgi:DNA polymerase-3 subunit gamma/tau